MAHSLSMLTLILLATGQANNEPFELDDVEVSLYRQVEVPVLQNGALLELKRADGTPVEEGDFVTEGEVIGKLKTDLVDLEKLRAEKELAIAALEADNRVDLEFAIKSLEVSEKELERSKWAVKQYAKVISKTELDRLTLVVQRTELQKQQAENDILIKEETRALKQQDVNIVSKRLDLHQIVAPLSGIITETYKQPGEFMNLGEPVLRIINLDTLKVEGFVKGEKYGPELIGSRVKFTPDKLPGNRKESFDGFIKYVSRELNRTTREAKFIAHIKNRIEDKNPLLPAGISGKLTIYPGDKSISNATALK